MTNVPKYIFAAALLLATVKAGYALGETQQEVLPGASSPGSHEREQATWYTCGMHPEIMEDHAGLCPKCGMALVPMAQDRALSLGLISEPPHSSEENQGESILYWKSPMIPGEIHQTAGKDSMGHDLVPVYRDEDEAASTNTIRISPVVAQNMGVRIADVISGPVVKTVRSVGFVSFDETTLTAVTTKVNGWIEKLYVEKTGDQVHRGEKLFEIYSPELFSAQEEYLAALRAAHAATGASVLRGPLDPRSLVEDARSRLLYFDVSEQQIQNIAKSGVPQKTLTIFAPATGIVTSKSVVQGQMVKSGEDLFRIADLSTVWLIAKIYESDLPYIKVGQAALMSLSYLPGKTFRGYVTYIYPFLDEKSREISVRMEFHNPGYELKPGMYATIELSSDLKNRAILVPDVAIIDTGLRKVAFASLGQGQFQLRNVVVGARSDGNYLEVLSGLELGEQVVTSGQFLLDSESRLREAALKFLKPKAEVSTPSTSRTSRQADEERKAKTSDDKTYYACPMPAHVDTLYDGPGTCPLCGMALVPVTDPANEMKFSIGSPPEEGTHAH